jgi:hypothetical protein
MARHGAPQTRYSYLPSADAAFGFIQSSTPVILYRMTLMRQRIDVAGLYADALAAMPETMDGQQPLPVPTECPVTLDDLLTFG